MEIKKKGENIEIRIKNEDSGERGRKKKVKIDRKDEMIKLRIKRKKMKIGREKDLREFLERMERFNNEIGKEKKIKLDLKEEEMMELKYNKEEDDFNVKKKLGRIKYC